MVFFRQLIKSNKIQLLQNISKRFYTPNAKQIKELREQTGSPINECKKALEEGQGNFQAAKEFLKQKGLANAEKRSDKEAKEGAIGVLLTSDRKKGVLIEVNCETDFVAKTELFQTFTNALLQSSLQQNEQLVLDQSGVQDLMNDTQCAIDVFPDYKNLSLQETQKLVISKLQENIKVNRLQTFVSEDSDYRLGSYVHNPMTNQFKNIGQTGCITSFNSRESNDNHRRNQILDQISMQILGTKPNYYQKSDIPKEIMSVEINRVMEELIEKIVGKPQEIIERMIEGKLKRFYDNEVLFSQEFLLESDKTVEEFLQSEQKKLNTNFDIKDHIVWFLKN